MAVPAMTIHERKIMRILCLVDSYFPSTKSSAKLMDDLARALLAEGHHVALAAPDDQLGASVAVRDEAGLTVLRTRSGRRKGANLITRAVNEIRMPRRMWKQGRSFFREFNCDLLIFYSPSIFLAPLVERIKRLHRCRTYLILRDIFPQWALDAGVLKPGLACRYFRRIERRQYGVADVIGVQSPKNLDYFDRPVHSDRYRLEVLFNWKADTPKPPSIGLREKLGLTEKVVFFYGGNIGIAQGMDALLELAQRLHDRPDAHLLLLGEGSEVPRLRTEANRRKLTNLTFHPAVPQADYLAAVGEFDVGLLSLDASLKTHNVPGKLLDYLYHGLPVLAAINPGNDLGEILTDADAGLVCLHGRHDALAQAARQLLDEPDRRQRMAQAARTLLQQRFTASAAAEQILTSATHPKEKQ
jgi:glycosyltransferase involved in cell wall biosynthesis